MRHFFVGLVLYTIFYAQPLLARDDFGNPAGIAENNVVMAYLHVAEWVSPCLKGMCEGLSTRDREILEAIVAAHPAELQAKNGVRFLSGRSFPDRDFFRIDGQIRVARTGSYVGDTLFFNTDLMYAPDPLSLQSAVALVLHELGHHHGESDHTLLDFIGHRVSLTLAGAERGAFLRGDLKHIYAKSVSFGEKHLEVAPRLYLSDERDLIEIKDFAFGASDCPRAYPRFRGIDFFNLHWKAWSSPYPWVVVGVSLYCADSDDRQVHSQAFALEVRMGFTFDDAAKARFIEKSFSVRKVSCALQPAYCLRNNATNQNQRRTK